MSGSSAWRRALAGVVCLAAVAGVGGCSDGSLPTDEPASVVLLSPQHGGPRWTDHDLPALRAQVEERCGDCTVRHVRSSGDQPADARRAVREGADVLVLAADDPGSAARVVGTAGEVPVVAVDRFSGGADYYVGPRPRRVASTLVRTARSAAGQGRILVLTGPDGSAETTALRQQTQRLRERGRPVVVAPGAAAGDPDAAGARVRRGLGEAGPPLAAVVVASEAATRGTVRALRSTGAGGGEQPVVVGRGSSLATVRRVVRGQQAAAVHTQPRHQAAYAAVVAATLLHGDEVADTTTLGGVPSLLTDVRAATLDSLTTVVVKDGTWTTREICDAPAVRQRCARLGVR